MGWTRTNLGVTVALAMEEHRRAAGQRLAKIRDAAGLNQEELAHKAGLAVKTISRLETGRHDGRRSTLKRVADALEVSVDDIVGPPPAPLGLGAGESQLDRIEALLLEVRDLLIDPEEAIIEGAAEDLSARQAETDSSDTARQSGAKRATTRARGAGKRSA